MYRASICGQFPRTDDSTRAVSAAANGTTHQIVAAREKTRRANTIMSTPDSGTRSASATSNTSTAGRRDPVNMLKSDGIASHVTFGRSNSALPSE